MSLKKKILYVALLSLGVGGLGLLGVRALIFSIKDGVNVTSAIIVTLVGMAVTGYFSVVLHELGHLFVGLIGGMKFKAMTFPFFYIAEINGKIRFRVTKKAEHLGYCEMYPPNDLDVKKPFLFMAIGGLVGSFFALGISLVFLLLATYINDYLVFLFGIPAFVPFAILLENSFPAVVGGTRTDGGVALEILRKTPSSKVMLAVLTMQASLRSGLSPMEAPFSVLDCLPQLPETDPSYVYLLNMRYLLALDKGDVDMIKDVDKRLRDVYPIIPDVYADQILPDLFYDNLFILPNTKFVVDNVSIVMKLLDRNDDVTACRIRGYYYLRLGDVDEAFRQIERGRSVAHLNPLCGLVKTELRLLDELEYSIRKMYLTGEVFSLDE